MSVLMLSFPKTHHAPTLLTAQQPSHQKPCGVFNGHPAPFLVSDLASLECHTEYTMAATAQPVRSSGEWCRILYAYVLTHTSHKWTCVLCTYASIICHPQQLQNCRHAWHTSTQTEQQQQGCLLAAAGVLHTSINVQSSSFAESQTHPGKYQ